MDSKWRTSSEQVENKWGTSSEQVENKWRTNSEQVENKFGTIGKSGEHCYTASVRPMVLGFISTLNTPFLLVHSVACLCASHLLHIVVRPPRN